MSGLRLSDLNKETTYLLTYCRCTYEPGCTAHSVHAFYLHQ